jgi:hypothetical protein
MKGLSMLILLAIAICIAIAAIPAVIVSHETADWPLMNDQMNEFRWSRYETDQRERWGNEVWDE